MTVTKKKLSPLDAALACQQKGDLDGAEAGFRAVLERDPDHPDALVLLGALLHKTKRAEEAVPLIERAIATAPERGRQPDPAWRVALSFAKRDAGDAEGALAELDALIAETSETPQLVFSRAGILQRLDRHEEAIAAYESFLRHAPNHAQAQNNLAISLKAVGQLKEAYDAFSRAIELRPNYVQALINVGQFLVDGGGAQHAIGHLRCAHSLDPENRTAVFALIDALQVGERAEDAFRLAEKVFARDPDDARAMIRLGNISMVMGQRARAVELARRAHESAPRYPGALSLLAEADREADPESLLSEIRGALGEGHAHSPQIILQFAAARLCERLKRHEEAFAHYSEGNAARKDQLERLGKGHDPEEADKHIDALIEAFGGDAFSGQGGSPSELPVFIVGMPRSGTTLTEQILASHPAVAGAGELTEIGRYARWLANEQENPAVLADVHLKEGARGYLTHIGKIGKGAKRVTDKMPGNYHNLGLIARMFPKARIVHCRRDPMDNCLSCFAQNFTADALGWSTDLEMLGRYYCSYQRLMAHWRAVLPPGRMLEVDYEDTVADLETQARRLVEFAGLEWDDACLEFHKTERAVATASREQVRNPIYRSSVGRWKRYGDGIMPLARALSACGCGPAPDGGEATT
jgi:tetratricopeptide (TPR) repeat protein